MSPFLVKLAQRLGKPKADLCIWDPYYCAGQVKVHLRKLGFKNVVNENKDFYALIEQQQLPPFDVLMTSPPYSRDHIERCLDFAVTCNKPFFILMPQYGTLAIQGRRKGGLWLGEWRASFCGNRSVCKVVRSRLVGGPQGFD